MTAVFRSRQSTHRPQGNSWPLLASHQRQRLHDHSRQWQGLVRKNEAVSGPSAPKRPQPSLSSGVSGLPQPCCSGTLIESVRARVHPLPDWLFRSRRRAYRGDDDDHLHADLFFRWRGSTFPTKIFGFRSPDVDNVGSELRHRIASSQSKQTPSAPHSAGPGGRHCSLRNQLPTRVTSEGSWKPGEAVPIQFHNAVRDPDIVHASQTLEPSGTPLQNLGQWCQLMGQPRSAQVNCWPLGRWPRLVGDQDPLFLSHLTAGMD